MTHKRFHRILGKYFPTNSVEKPNISKQTDLKYLNQ